MSDNVTKLSSFGLRTLVEGVRLLKPGEWLPLQQALNEARTNMEDRTEVLAKAYQSIEKDLMLIGCTGVEDKLQDDVPETLTTLREAGIQVGITYCNVDVMWMSEVTNLMHLMICSSSLCSSSKSGETLE